MHQPFLIPAPDSAPRPDRLVVHARGAWLMVVTLLALQAAAGAQRPTETVLKSVQVAVEDGLTVVTIDADGALPLARGHSLEGPARIYFDLPGVGPMASGTTTVPGAGVVTRVRISLNSLAPTVTRVVLDLGTREPFTVKADERQAGRIRIVVGAKSGQAPPTQSAAAPTPLSAREAAAYRSQLAGALERIEARRSVVSAIETDAEVPIDVLRAAQADFVDLRRLLAAAKPSSAAKPTHDLLIVSCEFGAIAMNLRIEAMGDSSPAARRNAASAAAGSSLLFSKACANLGCPAKLP